LNPGRVKSKTEKLASVASLVSVHNNDVKPVHSLTHLYNVRESPCLKDAWHRCIQLFNSLKKKKFNISLPLIE